MNFGSFSFSRVGSSPNVFVIAIVFVFLVVFLLVGSCFLITLIKCLNDRSLKVFSKCICHCFCLCCCIFLVRSCFLISLINVLMVKGLKDRYLKVWCSLYVFVIVIVSVFVLVMFFVDQVMFSHDPYQLFMLCN